jgi:triacylglycerol lipase
VSQALLQGLGIVLCLGLAAGVLLVLVHRRARARGRRWLADVRLRPARVAPRYPVILLHGLLGFDEVGVGAARQHYFRGLTESLENLGAEVHRPEVSRVAGVRTRAAQLARRLHTLPAKRVNVVAHSLGGLDARYAIAELGLADRVASLTTIGTPHRGTPLADLAGVGEKLGARRMLSAIRLDFGGFFDVTHSATRDFNERIEDQRGVSYGCVVAHAQGSDVNPLLRAGHVYLTHRAGPNDGVVPLHSQVWGEVLAEIEADHWAQIGWSRHFDATAFFAELLRELRGRGF